MQSGLLKTWPCRKDSSLLHSFGDIIPDPKSLPANFSIYDGRTIPNQDLPDTRFIPAVRPLLQGCTGESQTLLGGLEDGVVYRPDDLYDNTPPFLDGVGRDMRASLQATIDHGYMLPDGTVGHKRTTYYNCYGWGPIDDFDAVRIALWLFQGEKRGVTVGSWWYAEFENSVNGSVPTPSFNTNLASLHDHVITGWRTLPDGTMELEDISHQGMNYGLNGLVYIARAIFNGLMAQPYTSAFTVTKNTATTPVPLGMRVWVDHLMYYLITLFKNHGLI